MKNIALLSSIFALGIASPLARQVASTCELDPTFGQGLSTPNYYVANWVSNGATDGDQCSVVESYDATGISWHSTFSWDQSRFIRGNPNAGYTHFKREDIAHHTSIPVSWEWDYEGIDVQAVVVYNLLGSGQGCPSWASWVISIWLGTIGDLVPNDGEGNDGELVDSTTISGVAFDVYRVPRASRIHWIFKAKEDEKVFNGDLVPFVKWPGENTSMASQIRCVWQVQGGTEIWGGKDAKFTTKTYKVAQNIS